MPMCKHVINFIAFEGQPAVRAVRPIIKHDCYAVCIALERLNYPKLSFTRRPILFI